MAPAERGRELEQAGGSVAVRLDGGRSRAEAVCQRRGRARAPQAGERRRGGAAAVRRTGLAERSGSRGGSLSRGLLSVTRRNTPAMLVFYFGLGVVVGMCLLEITLRGRDWSSSYCLNEALGPAHGVVWHDPHGLLERAQVHRAGVAVALPGHALHAATARHQAVGVEDGLGRERARQDTEQQRRRQDRPDEGEARPERCLPDAPQIRPLMRLRLLWSESKV